MMLGSKFSWMVSRESVKGKLKRCNNPVKSLTRCESKTLYCGIDWVNSLAVLLISPTKKKNTKEIKTKSKVMANQSGIRRCVIALIIGEQIIAINSDSKNGTTISAANFTPAKIIITEAMPSKVRCKFKLFCTKSHPRFLRPCECGSLAQRYKQKFCRHRFCLFVPFQ